MNKDKSTKVKKIIKIDKEDVDVAKIIKKNEDIVENKNKILEWVPWYGDEKAWDKVPSKYTSTLYHYNKAIPKLELCVTKEKIEIAKKMNEPPKYKELLDDEFEIYKVYKIYDIDETINPICSYTRNTLENALLSDLMYLYKNDKKNGKLTPFINNIENMRYKLLDCYKAQGSIIKDMISIKQNFDDTFENIEVKTKSIVNETGSIFDIYKKTINSLLSDYEKSKLKKKKYYIYTIFDKNDDEKKFIIGVDYILKKDNILNDVCKKYDFTIAEKKININMLEEFDCYLKCECDLKVDEYIKQHDTINNGLNKFYTLIKDKYITYTKYDIVNIKNDIFINVQKNIMINMIETKYKKNEDNGFIACIENSNEKYIVSGYNVSLMNRLYYLYTIDNIDILKKNKFIDLKIYYLEKHIEKDIIDIQYEYYKKQFDIKCDELNSDKIELQIKELEKKIWSSRYVKKK